MYATPVLTNNEWYTLFRLNSVNCIFIYFFNVCSDERQWLYWPVDHTNSQIVICWLVVKVVHSEFRVSLLLTLCHLLYQSGRNIVQVISATHKLLFPTTKFIPTFLLNNLLSISLRNSMRGLQRAYFFFWHSLPTSLSLSITNCQFRRDNFPILLSASTLKVSVENMPWHSGVFSAVESVANLTPCTWTNSSPSSLISSFFLDSDAPLSSFKTLEKSVRSLRPAEKSIQYWLVFNLIPLSPGSFPGRTSSNQTIHYCAISKLTTKNYIVIELYLCREKFAFTMTSSPIIELQYIIHVFYS